MNIRHAAEAERDHVCDLLASGFYHDPILNVAFADSAQESRLASLRQFFAVYVNLACQHGGILLADHSAGALVYFRPDILTLSASEHEHLHTQLRTGCPEVYHAVAALMNGLDAWHPQSPPHYYIFAIAVERQQRRNGVATALIGELNSLLNQTGLPCYAECTALTTQALFRGCGYQAMPDHIQIDGFPELYPVWRDAQ